MSEIICRTGVAEVIAKKKATSREAIEKPRGLSHKAKPQKKKPPQPASAESKQC